MKRAKLEDFRYPKSVSSTDPSWPTLKAWQRNGWLRVRPETKHVATVELTAAGLQLANRERGTA